MTLAERIRGWRQTRKGLTQAKLAEAVGVSPAAVAYWELGQTEPTQANLAKLVDALGVSLAQFWGAPPRAKRRGRAA